MHVCLRQSEVLQHTSANEIDLDKLTIFKTNNHETLARHSRLVPYFNSFHLDETPSNSVSHPDPSCLTLKQHLNQLWATL